MQVEAVFGLFQSVSENALAIVGAMVVDEVLNTNTLLTHLNLSGKITIGYCSVLFSNTCRRYIS